MFFGRTCCALIVLGAATFTAEPARAQSACPADKAEWIEWRNTTINEMLTPTNSCPDFGTPKGGHPNFCTRTPHREEQYLCRKNVSNAGAEALEVIDRCDPSEEIRKELLANLVNFSTSLGQQFKPEHTRGFSIPDKAYIEYAGDAIAFPELLQSQPFLKAVSDPAHYKDALDMIEARNAAVKDKPGEQQWTTLLYEAPFLPSPDCKTYGQFAVYIPGEISKYIQFGILTPEQIGADQDKLNGVSIVSVKATGKPPPNISEVFIVDYWREYHDDQVILEPKIIATGESTNCYACHKTSVMPFYPDRGFTFEADGSLIEAPQARTDELRDFLNNQQAYAGPPYFGGLLEPAHFGPAIGPADRYRSQEFMASCTAEWPDVDDEKIAQMMDCASCHNENLIGAMNFPQAVPSDRDVHGTDGLGEKPWQTLTFVETFIQLDYMPPGLPEKLSADEKSALSNCLLKEYYDHQKQTGLFYDWLRNEVD